MFPGKTKVESPKEELSGPDWTASVLNPSQNCEAGSSPGVVQSLPWLTCMPP